MGLVANSLVSTRVDSNETGLELGRGLMEGFSEPPSAIFVVTTNNHDREELLRGLVSAVGPKPVVVGCSSQGVMGRGIVHEAGYVAGAMALGGEGVHAAAALARDIQLAARAKGRALGEELIAGLPEPPKVVVLLYDPICGSDVGALLEGLQEVVGCPVIGGGAGQDFGPMVATYQFFGTEVHRSSAVALALAGAFSVEMGACHGTAPVGIGMTVTKADGPCLLELDGRRAADVWGELSGRGDLEVEHAANMAIGLPGETSEQGICRVLAPFGLDSERGGIIVHASIPGGTEVMFHHRTEESVREGTRAMARQLVEGLGGRRPRAVLGFECGARTAPFLGREGTTAENLELQETLAPDAAWLGILAWGEIYPLRRGAAVFNFTYPVLCLCA